MTNYISGKFLVCHLQHEYDLIPEMTHKNHIFICVFHLRQWVIPQIIQLLFCCSESSGQKKKKKKQRDPSLPEDQTNGIVDIAASSLLLQSVDPNHVVSINVR